MSRRHRPSNRVTSNPRRVLGPPEGQPWVWHTRELISSPSWRARSLNCRRLLEFLELDNMAHAGLENGFLHATWQQLERWGINRRLISATIKQAEDLGLVRLTRGSRASYAKTNPTRFRLTYLPDRNINEHGQVYYGMATNEWKRATAAQAAAITGNKIAPIDSEHRPTKYTATGVPGTPPQRVSNDSPIVEPQKSANSRHAQETGTGVLSGSPSISRPPAAIVAQPPLVSGEPAEPPRILTAPLPNSTTARSARRANR
jgi:hypothetical protein